MTKMLHAIFDGQVLRPEDPIPLTPSTRVRIMIETPRATRTATGSWANRVIQATLDRLGGLDILINSVGGSTAPGGGALTVTDDHWQQSFDLNLFSAVRLDRGFLPSMLAQRRGVIIPRAGHHR